jgi:hypothetical protein
MIGRCQNLWPGFEMSVDTATALPYTSRMATYGTPETTQTIEALLERATQLDELEASALLKESVCLAGRKLFDSILAAVDRETFSEIRGVVAASVSETAPAAASAFAVECAVAALMGRDRLLSTGDQTLATEEGRKAYNMLALAWARTIGPAHPDDTPVAPL